MNAIAIITALLNRLLGWTFRAEDDAFVVCTVRGVLRIVRMWHDSCGL
jgi:hypothetical protein